MLQEYFHSLHCRRFAPVQWPQALGSYIEKGLYIIHTSSHNLWLSKFAVTANSTIMSKETNVCFIIVEVMNFPYITYQGVSGTKFRSWPFSRRSQIRQQESRTSRRIANQSQLESTVATLSQPLQLESVETEPQWKMIYFTGQVLKFCFLF